MADLPGWPYWKVISITGQAGSGTDYQVELEIGDSAGGDFNLGGRCTNFPQDIRITDDDGTTLLDHFVEDLTADPIVVHIEVKDDLGSNRDIRIYYGKSGETTASNGDNTFLFFDDFPGSSLDTSKWDGSGVGSVSVSNSIIDFAPYYDIQSKASFGNNHILEYYANLVNDRATTGFCTPGNNLDAYWNAFFIDDAGPVRYTTAGDDSSTTYDNSPNVDFLNTWRRFKIAKSSTDVKSYIDDTLELTSIKGTGISREIRFSTDIPTATANGDLRIDWVFVRKYNSPEPAFSSAGAEQTPGVGAAPTGVFYGPLVGPFGGPL